MTPRERVLRAVAHQPTDRAPADYGAPQASTGDTSYRVTGLINGETYNFAVRARDAAPYNNTDTNTIVLQAVPQGLSTVSKTDTNYYANGTTTTWRDSRGDT